MVVFAVWELILPTDYKGVSYDRKRMTEDMQVRNLAVNTQESYLRQVSQFARHFNKSPELLCPEDIRTYQVY